MAREKFETFRVEGVGEFPYDMLRYDACWPAFESDSAQITPHQMARRIVCLKMNAPATVTRDRWASFGWTVI